MTSCHQTVTSLSFFHFFPIWSNPKANAQPVQMIFSLTVTFYLTKTENRTKHLQENADISKVMRVLVPKVIFSEAICGCVLACQISSLQHNYRKFQTGGNFISPPPSQNEPLKSPPRLGLKTRHLSESNGLNQNTQRVSSLF